MENSPFVFACPVCRGKLVNSANGLCCLVDELTFICEEKIWRFLPPGRAAALAQFRQEYEAVRRSEGRGSSDPAFYRALPFVVKNQQISQIKPIGSQRKSIQSFVKNGWEERALSFGVLLAQVVQPWESQLKRPLHILDLGAGNGWLANRLAARGHHLAAVDLGVNTWDGLGANRHYQTEFTCLQAEYDHLPLEANQADLVIFNASFHYSVNYKGTLQEALRVLQPGGAVVVMDTAVYQQKSSGQQMVAEREAAYLQKHGFASNVLPSENFLTPGRLNQLAAELGVRWRQIETVPRWRRWIRQAKVVVRRQREPAQFPIVLVTAEDAESPEDGEASETAIKDLANSINLSVFSLPSTDQVVHKLRIGRNAGWLLGARLGQQAILLLFTALVARQLGEAGLGQFAWVTAVLYLGNVFSTFGLDTVLLRQIGAARRTDTIPLVAALILQLLFALIFILFLWLLPFAGQSGETVTGVRLYGWSLLPLAWLTLTSAALRGYEQMGWLAVLTLGTAVLQLGGTAVLLGAGGGFIGLMGWLLAVQAVAAGASWQLCRWLLPNFSLNWQFLRRVQVLQMARTGFWLALLLGTAVLLQRWGIFLVGRLGTEAQTGQLAAALRLVEAARLLPGAVMGALFPVLAREKLGAGAWRQKISSRQSPLSGYRWGLVAYGTAAAVGLWLLARPLVGLLFGADYETAASLLPLLAWGVVPFTISLPVSVELVVAGREKRVLAATFLVLMATAVLTTAAFVSHGLPGVVAGLVIGEGLLAVALLAARQYTR